MRQLCVKLSIEPPGSCRKKAFIHRSHSVSIIEHSERLVLALKAKKDIKTPPLFYYYFFRCGTAAALRYNFERKQADIESW